MHIIHGSTLYMKNAVFHDNGGILIQELGNIQLGQLENIKLYCRTQETKISTWFINLS